jgi:hypothetical protein
VVDGGCTLAAPPAFGDCAATGYSLATDGGSGHLVSATTDLGVSDEEPGMYRGENWVGQALGLEPVAGSLESLPRSTGFAQTFGVLVNSALPITSISAQDVASIYAGNYSDWSQVQDQATGNALPALPITVCRREQGSGTQVAAAIHFPLAELRRELGTVRRRARRSERQYGRRERHHQHARDLHERNGGRHRPEHLQESGSRGNQVLVDRRRGS